MNPFGCVALLPLPSGRRWIDAIGGETDEGLLTLTGHVGRSMQAGGVRAPAEGGGGGGGDLAAR